MRGGGVVNKVERAVCGLRFADASRLSAGLGSTFRDLSIGTLHHGFTVHHLATNAYSTKDGDKVAPLTREQPRRRYTPRVRTRR